jgi:hypothetical protein
MAANKYAGKTEGFFMMLSGLYCHPEGRKQLTQFVRSVAGVLALDNPNDKFYLLTDCKEDLVFEQAGFQRLK